MSHRLFLNKLTGSARLGQLLTRQNPLIVYSQLAHTIKPRTPLNKPSMFSPTILKRYWEVSFLFLLKIWGILYTYSHTYTYIRVFCLSYTLGYMRLDSKGIQLFQRKKICKKKLNLLKKKDLKIKLVILMACNLFIKYFVYIYLSFSRNLRLHRIIGFAQNIFLLIHIPTYTYTHVLKHSGFLWLGVRPVGGLYSTHQCVIRHLSHLLLPPTYLVAQTCQNYNYTFIYILKFNIILISYAFPSNFSIKLVIFQTNLMFCKIAPVSP
ncbi:unnamed protein product [Ceratitis capitata]|uniref:(Mediterranean fruit fly) hypothetical protein n=1 Tax=Ceratitis capitata TaxID=7213 RepID=A0A811UB10_CERCA|nr:unnamed protein product [Ceratitis capitata]